MWINGETGEIYGGDLRFGTADFAPPSDPPAGVTHAVLDASGNFVEWGAAPDPEPDWAEAIDEFYAVTGFLAAYSPLTFRPEISTRLGLLASGDAEWQGGSDRLITCWNQGPTASMIPLRSAMNTAAETYNLPVRVDAAGALELA